MQRKNKGSALGISLILVVFILLCLITFGTLSYLLAKVDNELSISSAENTLEYYAADTAAKDTLRFIDTQLAATYDSTSTLYFYSLSLQAGFAEMEADDVFLSGEMIEGEETLFLTYTAPVNETETLSVTLQLHYPVTDTYYTITDWSLVSTAR